MEDITNLQINITCQCHKSSLTFVCKFISMLVYYLIWHFTDFDLDNWRGQHVGQGMLTHFANTWFHLSHVFMRLVHVVTFNLMCHFKDHVFRLTDSCFDVFILAYSAQSHKLPFFIFKIKCKYLRRCFTYTAKTFSE